MYYIDLFTSILPEVKNDDFWKKSSFFAKAPDKLFEFHFRVYKVDCDFIGLILKIR